ncbi:MAG: hypothetical protein JXO22_01945 [Phycisphaerae bacterium]|nr:hypothetical protein [Phycisphaerae bacterium]
MELTTESGWGTKSPGPRDIERALGELWREDGFLILARADEDYVQAVDCTIEYRQNGRHYRYETPEPDPELVRSILLSYQADDDQWKAMVAWEDVTTEFFPRHRQDHAYESGDDRSRRMSGVPIVIIIAVVVAVGAWIVSRM